MRDKAPPGQVKKDIPKISDEVFEKLSGGRVSVKELADMLNIPEAKRRNFYSRLWHGSVDVHPFD